MTQRTTIAWDIANCLWVVDQSQPSTKFQCKIMWNKSCSRVFYSGADLMIFVTDAQVPPKAEGASFLGGSGGMVPRKILKYGVSEMWFPPFESNI